MYPDFIFEIEVIEDSENYYLFLEYIRGGSIQPIMKQPISDMVTLRSYMRDILYGLEYLHSKSTLQIFNFRVGSAIEDFSMAILSPRTFCLGRNSYLAFFIFFCEIERRTSQVVRLW